MSVSKKLRGIALAGLAASVTLTGSFNQAAFAENAPEPIVSDTITAPAVNDNSSLTVLQSDAEKQRIAALNEKMVSQLKAIDSYFNAPGKPANFDSALDPIGIQMLEDIEALVKQGADPNYIDPASKMSVFVWATWMAYELDRPDVVETFLKRGADPKMALPKNTPVPQAELNAMRILMRFGQNMAAREITMMDHALRTVVESQLMHRKHVETAVKIVQMFEAHGAHVINDTQVMRKPGATGLESFALSPTGLSIMVSMGAVDQAKLDPLVSPTTAEQNELNNTQFLTKEFLEKHGAPLLDYTDALPGGAEPYEVQDGDTLESLGKRFRHAMSVADADEAVKKLAAENNIDLTAPDALTAPLTAGTKINIPVPVEHQIGYTGVSPASPLFGVAHRVMQILGTDDLNATLQNLAETSGLKPGPGLEAALQAGNKLSYKVPGTDTTAEITIEPTDAITGVAVLIKGTIDVHKFGEPHKQGHDSIEDIIEQIAEMNGLDLQGLKDGSVKLASDQKLLITYLNDNYHHLDKLVPPTTYDPDNKVGLIVIEDKDYHGKRTFGVASNSNYALNPDVDLSRFFSWDENLFSYPYPNASPALRMMMNLDGSPLQNRVVFSFSMAMAVDVKQADEMRQGRRGDDMSYESIKAFLDEMETNKPIIFGGAGNWRQNIRGKGDGDERYVQSYLAMHSPRAVNVGSAGQYPNVTDNGKMTVSPYSSYAGDICAALPKFLADQQEGTSFSTPTLAGIERQLLEWYGNKLTFEEIMSVGYMLAARDLMDFDPAGGHVEQTPNGPKSVPAIFRTNGAGMPIHERCGPGNLDRETVAKWNETLKLMVEMKDKLNSDAEFRSHVMDIGDAAEVRTDKDGKPEYIYRVTVPQDMTLGKLTFLLPQHRGEHSEVYVKTPAGFEVHLPKSLYDVVSSRAFNYEDVKAGSVIEIRTGAPLADTATIYLRGHDDGNVIQMMRDHLRKEGVLHEPLKTMVGGKIVTDEEAAKLEQRSVVKTQDLPQIVIPAPK